MWREGEKIVTPVDMDHWLGVMTGERYRAEHKLPLSARLPFHYHKIPGGLRNLLARLSLRKKPGGPPVFPVDSLNCGPEIFRAATMVGAQPAGSAVLVLTHDIDTGRGFELLERVAKMEEGFGFRSSWHVVADHYLLDGAVLNDLRHRGHEIGLHGLWHTNREAFLAPDALRAELSRVKPLIDAYGMGGYRGPSWYRTAAMYPVLAEFFEYDLSCLDIDLSCPGGPGGVGLARAFRRAEGMVEIPCTLPFESPLHQGRAALGLADYWGAKVDFVARAGGALVVNTHPEPNYLGDPVMLAEYEALLRRLAQEGWACRLPGQVAADRELVA